MVSEPSCDEGNGGSQGSGMSHTLTPQVLERER